MQLIDEALVILMSALPSLRKGALVCLRITKSDIGQGQHARLFFKR
jgi:hypothetical protein